MRKFLSLHRLPLLCCHKAYQQFVLRGVCFLHHQQQHHQRQVLSFRLLQVKSGIGFVVTSSLLSVHRFSNTTHRMAKILSGREVSAEILQRLKKEVEELKIRPKLAVVQVGNREDSNVYIRMKMKFAEEIGATSELTKLSNQTSEEEVIREIERLNRDPEVHGIIVQLPLQSDKPISQDKITNLVAPEKDVDGLSDLNAGKLFHGQVKGDTCFLPCTPNGCMELIRKSGATIAGSHCVVVGRSKIVGSPMAQLLLWNNATVTIAHSRTKDLASIVRQADILVVAVGVAGLVRGDWIKPGAVVIDCGISAVPDATKKSGQRLVGDVVYEEAKEVASAITPVPGGVGPMTVAMLISNTVQAAKNRNSDKK